MQKLNYIHNNPTVSKWKLANLPEEYFHLCAAFYMLNREHKFIRLTHWKDVGERLTHRPPRRATVYPQVILVLHKHNKMELIAHRPNYAGLFKDKRLEKRGL